MESDEWEKQGARLRYDQQADTYYLHVSVTQERDESSGEAENQTVLGVDRNVDRYLAVTSTGDLAAEETRNPNIPIGESHLLEVGGDQKEFVQYLREELEGDE